MAEDDYSGRHRRYLELPSFTWTEWDSVQLVKSAVRSLELGQFDSAALVADAMTRDDRVKGALQKRTEAIPSLARNFVEGKGAGAAQAVEVLTEAWCKMFPPEAVAELSKWGFLLGLGLAQNLWELVDGKLTLKLKVWHPRYVFWRWDTRSFWVNTTTGTIEVTHGDGQWVVYAPWGLDRAYMMGAIRSLYVPWLVRQWGWRDLARYSEVHGLPVRKAFVPADAQADDKARFLRECADIGSESVVRLPRSAANPDGGFDLELMEAVATGHALFVDLLTECNSSLAITILGQNLSTEVKGGSFAAAGVHGSVETGVLKRDGCALAEALKTGSVEPWAALNFGSKDAAPTVEFQTDPPEDKKARGETLELVGKAITSLNDAGLPVDGDKLAKQFGIPLREGESFTVQPTAAETAEKAAAAAAASEEKKQAPRGPKGLSTSTPAVDGQVFVDKLAASSRAAGVAALEHDLDGLLKVIDGAKDFDELRGQLERRYAKMKPDALAEVLKAALMLAELNGRHAVREELE